MLKKKYLEDLSERGSTIFSYRVSKRQVFQLKLLEWERCCLSFVEELSESLEMDKVQRR